MLTVPGHALNGKKRSVNILLNIFCVWWNRLNIGLKQLEGELMITEELLFLLNWPFELSLSDPINLLPCPKDNVTGVIFFHAILRFSRLVCIYIAPPNPQIVHLTLNILCLAQIKSHSSSLWTDICLSLETVFKKYIFITISLIIIIMIVI